MISPFYSRLRAIWLNKGYPWYRNPYDLNVFGIRSLSPEPDSFDDTIGIAYSDADGNERVFACPGTTDPGLFYLQNPMNSVGCAIMKPGHWRNLYRIGKHKGYTALVQINPVTILLDADRDKLLDFNVSAQQTGLFGINLHRALEFSLTKTVGKFSAGCQVVQSPDDFAYILSLVRRQKAYVGSDVVSYTLLLESDI